MFRSFATADQHRRSFLQLGAAGLLGLALPRVLRAEATGKQPTPDAANNLILIWLGGGPSTIDMWDPKPDAPDNIRGEFATISTAMPEVRISEHLPKMAKTLDRCTLIRSLKHSIPAHGPGSQYVLTGHLPSTATEYPSLGSIAARMLPSRAAIPPFVAFNNPSAGGSGYLGSAWDPFEVNDDSGRLPSGVSLGDNVDEAAFSARVRLRNQFDKRFDKLNHDPVASSLDVFQQQAVDVLRKDSIRRALDVENETEEVRGGYGSRSPLGRNALRACRLIEAGARFVTVGTTGWDTHANNFVQLQNNLLPQLDQALSALVADLEARSLLSSTIVCCCGEFGRTPTINDNAGRDHWSRAMSVLLAGGGFKSGYLHGATDKQGGEPIEDACTPADLAATILQRLGIAPTSKVKTLAGREMPISADGHVIEQLVT